MKIINSHREITEEEINKSPILILKEIEGKILNNKNKCRRNDKWKK